MVINQLNTSNTFGQWLNTTIDVVSTLNDLTDGGPSSTFYVNTNLQIANNLTVNANVTILGNVGDLNISGNVVVTSNVSGPNLIISDTLTTNNLVVSSNLDTVNISSNLYVAEDVYVYNNLIVSDTSTVDTINSSVLAVISTANITSLIGDANTQIYNYIEAVANGASAQALAADYLSLAIALG